MSVPARPSPIVIALEEDDEPITIHVTIKRSGYELIRKKARLEGTRQGDIIDKALVFYYQHGMGQDALALSNREGTR